MTEHRTPTPKADGHEHCGDDLKVGDRVCWSACPRCVPQPTFGTVRAIASCGRHVTVEWDNGTTNENNWIGALAKNPSLDPKRGRS